MNKINKAEWDEAQKLNREAIRDAILYEMGAPNLTREEFQSMDVNAQREFERIYTKKYKEADEKLSIDYNKLHKKKNPLPSSKNNKEKTKQRISDLESSPSKMTSIKEREEWIKKKLEEPPNLKNKILRDRLAKYEIKTPNDKNDFYETFPGKYETEKEFDQMHREYGRDPEFEKGKYDDFIYDEKVGKRVRKLHEPTWTDRGKELTQGLAKGVGNLLIDTPNKIVGAPLTFLGSKFFRGAEIGSRNTKRPDLEEKYRKIADDLQQLSNKYLNSNVGNEWKNSKFLRTKNADNTSLGLKGGGEFLPDLIPANLLGKVAKGAVVATRTAPAISKGLFNKAKNFIKDPYPGIANMLETKITPRNAMMFAGTGAAHNIHNADSQGKENSNDTSFLGNLSVGMAGGIAGGAASGIARGGKNIVKNLYKSGKNVAYGLPNGELGYIDRKLAEKIGKDAVLDENIIKLYKENNLDLTPFDIYTEKKMRLLPFDIYKKNPNPYQIISRLPSDKNLDILPQKKEGIRKVIENILDNDLGIIPTDKDNSTVTHAIADLQDYLNKEYQFNKAINRNKYDLAMEKLDGNDVFQAKDTTRVAKKIIKETTAPAIEGTAIGKLNAIANNIRKQFKAYDPEDFDYEPFDLLIDPKEALVQRKALNQYIKKGDVERRGGEKLKRAIDADLESSIRTGNISNPEFLKYHNDANSYYAENIAPFKKNRLFNKIKQDTLNYNDFRAKEVLENTFKNKKDYSDLTELMNLAIKKYDRKNKITGKIDNTEIEAAQQNLDLIKRLKIQDKLFKDAIDNDYDMNHLQKNLSNNHLFGMELANKLKKLNPLINKYKEMKDLDKKYHSGLDSNSNSNSNNNSNSNSAAFSMRKKELAIPSIIGAGVGGSVAGPFGAALGGLGAFYTRNLLANKLANTITNKDFVEELIRLGRLPVKAKKTMIQRLNNNPQLKFELIRTIYEDSNKLNKEKNKKKKP
jgi:hypothetical protein